MKFNGGFSFIGLVLAAGYSSRLGRPKQELLWGHESLVSFQVSQMIAADAVKVFIASRKALKFSDARAQIIEIPECAAQAGIGASLRIALKNLPPEHALMIGLCDLIFRGEDFYPRLRQESLEGTQAVATLYEDGCLGVPAMIPISYRSKLQISSDTRGLGPYLNASRGAFKAVKPLHPPLDIDTPTDLVKFDSFRLELKPKL